MGHGSGYQTIERVVGFGRIGRQSAVLELVSSSPNLDGPAQMVADARRKGGIAAVYGVLNIAQHFFANPVSNYVKRATAQYPVLRNYAETHYGAKSWTCQRRVVARIEASTLGMDIRYVVTSLTEGSAEHIYDTLYCARGQAENLIKRHKAQLASDRTSCRSANAKQMRLILHTAAYWLLWRVQQAIPTTTALATAEFSTLHLRLLKVAARVIETSSRIRLAFASACPEAGVFKAIATSLRPAPT